jgi:predicted dehydrogenase
MFGFFNKIYSILVFCFSLSASFFLHAHAAPPTVLVVGYGFTGAYHVKNLEMLQKGQLVAIAGIVDTDSKRLEGVSYPCFLDFFEAYQEISPDIVVVAVNTQAHYEIIQDILTASAGKKAPALFIEKPLVETSAQAEECLQLLHNYPAPITCGYQFRNSPIVDKAVRYIKDHNLNVENIQAVWQKKRLPTRPTAGVHIDEATHPVDLILNYLLPAFGLANEPISLLCHSRKYDDSFFDKEQQAALYPGQPEKLLPLAEVGFEIQTPDIDISVFSSFVQAPQVREIILHCSSNTKVKLSFDKDQADQISITSSSHRPIMETFENPNKVLLEWQAFLQYYQTGKPSRTNPTLQDMVSDIQITEMLNEVPLDQPMQVLRE